MTKQEMATNLTIAWVEKTSPRTWLQVAEAYTGLFQALNESNENPEKASLHWSELSAVAQKNFAQKERAGKLSDLKAEVQKGSN